MTNSDEKALLALAGQHLYPNYRQPPCVFVRGKGCEVWDKSGKRYLDLAAGVAVYVGFSICADAGRVASALARFHWLAALLACLLALGNYLVRFGRWQYYLRVLGIRVPARDSLQVFLAGFALTVTPGKLGEAVKAFLLRESHRVPVSRTAPIVIAPSPATTTIVLDMPWLLPTCRSINRG